MKFFRHRPRLAVAAYAILAATPFVCAPLSHASPQAASAAIPERSTGGKIYDKWCRDCHAAGGPGSRALQRKYQGALPAVLEQRNNLPPEYVKLVVRRGMSFMPTFRKTEISDAELALVADYLTPSR